MTLTCSANGYPAPVYTIKRQGTEIVSNGGKVEITDVMLGEEANTYTCETQNAVGSGPTEQLQITVLGKDQDYLFKAMLNNQPVLCIISNQVIFSIPSEMKWYCVDFRGWNGWGRGGGGDFILVLPNGNFQGLYLYISAHILLIIILFLFHYLEFISTIIFLQTLTKLFECKFVVFVKCLVIQNCIRITVGSMLEKKP